MNTAIALEVTDKPELAKTSEVTRQDFRPTLATATATALTSSFFHCRHGRPEHHRCPQCENESQNLPGFFDD